MSEKDNEELMDDENDEIIIAMTDDEGNQYYYAQELILQVGGEKYALLVPTVADEEAEGGEHHHADGEPCGCGEDDEDAAFFAKIVLDENGEEAYIEPTDEEFEAVCAAYDELLEEDDEDE